MNNYEQIINDLNNKGYSEIDNFLNKDDVQNIKKYLIAKKNQYKTDNFSLADKELDDNIFQKIKEKKEFLEICSNILNFYKIKYNPNEDKDIHIVLGNRIGKNINKKMTPLYHFDAFLLTILFPIAFSK